MLTTQRRLSLLNLRCSPAVVLSALLPVIAWVGRFDVRDVCDHEDIVSGILNLILHHGSVEGLGNRRQRILLQEAMIVLLSHELLGSSLDLDARVVGLLVDGFGRESRLANGGHKVLHLFLGDLGGVLLQIIC